MAHRKTLNEKQLEVLRWIADGCPDGVMAGYAHRISTASLRARQLVETSGSGANWSAQITEAGRNYLERAAGPQAPVPRQASVSVTQQLVDDVIAAGNSLRVPQRPYYSREGVDYANRAQLAERHGKVPEGKRLVVRAVSREELQIDLVDAPEDTVLALRPVPVPAKVARYHPVVKQFKAKMERHEVSRALLPRALRLLQGLVAEAERRGHQVELAAPGAVDHYGRRSWTGAKNGHIVISADGCAAAVRVKEEGLQSRTYWELQNQSYSRWSDGEFQPRLPPRSDYEESGTGRLGLELVSGCGEAGRPVKWADRKSWALEDKLPELLREIEVRAVERDHRQREAERQAQEREHAWQAAMQRAGERHAEHQRSERLRAEVGQWRDAQQIRAYCEAAKSAYPDVAGTAEWIGWARRYADELDPLNAAPQMPALPESVSPNELRPYLEGWDPYGSSGDR